MADSTDHMNLGDMLELLKGGAKIEIARPPQRIAQFDELINTLKTMVEGREASAKAEIERNQVQMEVLSTLQAIIHKKSGSIAAPAVDLAPLQAVLEQVVESNNREPADYDFKILRTGPGMALAHTIEARVVRTTKH